MSGTGWPAVHECTRVVLAGAPVSIAASSPWLGAMVARPFTHLPRASGPAALRVEALAGIEGVETGPDRIDLADGGAIVTHVRPDGGAVLDRRAGLLRVWWAREDAVAAQERTKPFVLCLALWLADRGVIVAHAGCVAGDAGAVLLVGPSGSGKSTAALACAAHGLAFLGDDQVALTIERGTPVVHSLYGTARLYRDHLASYPWLACAGPVVETDDEKPILVLGESAARLAPSGRIVAIAIVGHGRNTVRAVSRAAALRALAPSSLARMPLGRTAFEQLASVAAAVPAVAIEATDPDALPALVDRVLEEVPG